LFFILLALVVYCWEMFLIHFMSW